MTRMLTVVVLLGFVLGGAAVVVLVSPVRQVVMAWLPPAWSIELSALKNNVRVDHGQVITMPDGVRLTASLYTPKDARGPLPTVLVRLPYHRLRYSEGYSAGLFFARNGYAVLVQDLRGTGDSGGELLPWRDVAADGVATLDWITHQPWSTGKVGTFGCSALGETQLVLATRNHPAHAAMIPSGAGGAVGTAAGRYGYFGLFEGGIYQLASGFGWFAEFGTKDPRAPAAARFRHADVLRRLPVVDLVKGLRPAPNGYADFLNAPLGDPIWEQWGYLTDADTSAVPALVINTWGDQTLGDTLALAEAWRVRGIAPHQKVIIAPGVHCQHEESGTETDHFGELPIAHAERPWKNWYLRWFDHWLRGKPDAYDDVKAYTYYMVGEDRWLEADRWPPAESRVERWFLASGGKANSRTGDGTLGRAPPTADGVDTFRYDPSQPVPSRGGPVCCTGEEHEKRGPADQADVETRDDVLVYTSTPLDTDLRIAGSLRAHLSVSSDAPDTDLVVRLVHVQRDGRSIGIQEGSLRLRYRNSYTRPEMMKAGQRYGVSVDMRAIAYRVPAGDRLRLHVTSSSFPRLERNLNTGAANNAHETQMKVATNHVHHSAAAESYLELPVLRPPR